MSDFEWPVRVYYEDTDSGGVVYHANYLKFMERARTEWLRARGIEQCALRDEHGVIFAVTNIELDYLRPARFNQSLLVGVRVLRMRRASVHLEQDVRLADDPQATTDKGTLCARGRVTVACIDAQAFHPRAFPDNVRREILGDR